MVFGKKCLVILALIFYTIFGSGYSLPSTIPLSTTGNAKNGKSTTPTTMPPSSTTSSGTTSVFASIPSTTTKRSRVTFHKTTTTTTTTTPVPSSTTTNEDAEYAGKNENSGKTAEEENNNTIIIACSIGGVILFIIILVVIGLLVWRCLKKRAAARSKPSDPSQQQQQIDGSKTPATDFKKTQTTPASPLKPWAPEHIPAETFAYKGPLVLQTTPPSEIQMVHELDNERAPSIHEDQHVQFDDTLNAAYEIGSEVEIFMDGEKQMPKKARSSLPSPYGEPGLAVAGGKKKKISEKQKDKAIRE